MSLTRISKDKYKKPANTVQDNLTQEDINILLEEYNEIDDIHQLKTGLHIRYYSIVKTGRTEKKLFRMGGTIIKIDFEKKYMVLSNGKLSWSVQLNDKNILYKKMTTEEIKEFYENELNTIETEQLQIKSTNDKLKINLKELYAQNQKLIEQNAQLNSKIEYQNKIIQKAKTLINN
jgi:hypothetical protein